MDESFIRNRITALRLKKQKSEYQMSYDLGHSRGYIYNISSGKALPSMSEFLAICDYFGITPMEFFDEGHEHPELLGQAIAGLSQLNDYDLHLVLTLIERLKQTDYLHNDSFFSEK